MKHAVILHGTDVAPDKHWFPWLKSKFDAEGYDVWVPLLPNNHTPNRETYNDFLFGNDWDFTDNIIVGHSSGAVEILNMLMDVRAPKIKLGVMVGAWAGGLPNGDWQEDGQFKDTFPTDGFDFAAIIQNADKLAFMHAADDNICPVEQAEYLANQLGATITVTPTGRHYTDNCIELPELWQVIESNHDD